MLMREYTHASNQILICHIRHRDMIAICMRTVKLFTRLHGMRVTRPRTACHTTHHIPQHGGTQDFVYPLTTVAHHAETAVDGFSDTYATSQILAAAIDTIGLDDDDIVFCGRQAIDGDTAQVGPQVAEKLGLTQVTYAEEILNVDKAAKKITVKRHIDGGVETVEAPLPIVITVNGSAAPCRPRNAKLVQKYKRALGAQEKAAITKEGAELAYADLYEKYPYLNITEWSVADVNGDLAQCGLSGSPTKVKTIQNISFQAKESKTLTGSDKDVEDLIVELLANHTIG